MVAVDHDPAVAVGFEQGEPLGNQRHRHEHGAGDARDRVLVGLAAVEQHVQHPAGRSVAACATGTSDRWIFADGFTGDDSPFQVVLTNPFPTPTIVDVSFVTAEARRAPRQLQGLVLESRSVRVLDLANQGARNETIVAVEVRASAGRLVAGKLQHYLGRGRLGFVAALGASAPSRSWWFPAGEKADGVAEVDFADGGVDVVFCKRGILSENLRMRLPSLQVIEDNGHHDSGTFDARFAMTDVRVSGNSCLPPFSWSFLEFRSHITLPRLRTSRSSL